MVTHSGPECTHFNGQSAYVKLSPFHCPVLAGITWQIDQAALTGESLPVKKFTGDVAFSGSTIKQGERHALVYATGGPLATGFQASCPGRALFELQAPCLTSQHIGHASCCL